MKPLLFKPHRLNGLSDKLLVSHYENNYGGALRRLNAIQAKLMTLDWPAAPVFEINGMKREELIAAGSVILHEIYFDALGGEGGDPPAGLGLAEALERDFGSLRAWHAEFTAMAKAQAGGSGWALLSWSPRLGRLVNQWAADHAHGLAGGHADPGARHVRAFLSHGLRHACRGLCRCGDGEPANGSASPRATARHGMAKPRTLRCSRRSVHRRRMAAVISAEELRDAMQREPPVLLDVCLAEDDLPRRTDMIPGATLHNPDAIDRWAAELPHDRPIAVYCMFGFQVSGNAVAELRRRGFDARSLKGGIAAWHAIGGPTVPLDASTYEACRRHDMIDDPAYGWRCCGAAIVRHGATLRRTAPGSPAFSRRWPQLGYDAEPAVYADEMADEVREQILRLDGVLVWVDPIVDGRNRSVLDAMLRDVASRGVWVSTHPDVILKMGVKEVLHRTKHLGWGTDTHLYRDRRSLCTRVPAAAAGGWAARAEAEPGQWRPGCVEGRAACRLRRQVLVRVLHARRGSVPEDLPLRRLPADVARPTSMTGAASSISRSSRGCRRA